MDTLSNKSETLLVVTAAFREIPKLVWVSYGALGFIDGIAGLIARRFGYGPESIWPWLAVMPWEWWVILGLGMLLFGFVKANIKQLNFIKELSPNKKITLKIKKKLVPHWSGNYHFRGSIYNGGDVIEDAVIKISHNQEPYSNIPRASPWIDGGRGPRDIHNGATEHFKIGQTSAASPTNLLFMTQDIAGEVGGPSVGAGKYSFKIRVYGKNIKMIEHRMEISIADQWSLDCIEILQGERNDY
jgi:hypothetical protein